MPHLASAAPRVRPSTAARTPQALVIAVEATRLATEVRGIGRYVRALLPQMLAVRPGTRFVLYVKPRDVAPLTEAYAADPALAGSIEIRPIAELRASRADVFWYPWNVVSVLPRQGAVVATMHDVAPLALPDPRLRKWRKNWRWRRRYRGTVQLASLLVVPSQFTADEIQRTLGVDPRQIRVTLLAADDSTAPPRSADAAVLARLGVKQPFVLTVGAGERRKNIALVERAMSRIVEQFPDVTLVLAGPRTHAQRLQAPPQAWSRTIGFVTDDELCALYRSAACMVMPSKYEGFGLPVLEAMGFGLPVVCARASSLPEVGGDAAAWVEPDDDAALVRILTALLSDQSLVARMRKESLAHASRFSWESTARLTLSAFDEAMVLAGSRPPASWLTRLRRAITERLEGTSLPATRHASTRALETT